MIAFSTLGRYIAGRFFISILGVYALVTLLVFMIDFVELLRQAGKQGSVSGGKLVTITLLRLPAYTEMLLPFAVLVGSIAALLMLSRKSELAVMRAGGMSVWQFLRPGAAVALTLGLLSVTVFNPLAASARDASERIYADAFGRESTSFKTGGWGSWLRQDGSDGPSIISAGYASNKGASLKNVTAFVYDQDGRFAERIDAAEADLKEGYWVLTDALVSRVGSEPKSSALISFPPTSRRRVLQMLLETSSRCRSGSCPNSSKLLKNQGYRLQNCAFSTKLF